MSVIQSLKDVLADADNVIQPHHEAAIREAIDSYAELLTMLERCVPHINPKVADTKMLRTMPIADCYLNTLALNLVKRVKAEGKIK